MGKFAFTFALVLAASGVARQSNAAAHWPQFRGPNGSGVAEEGSAPIHFGPASNVLWKVELPSGNSSPCIWGDRIFLTAFDRTKLETICLDRRNGKMVWRQSAPAEKFEPTHRIGSPAGATAATDGQRVYVYFGSFGLLAYDFDGTEQWRKPLNMPVVEFGAGTSPVLAGNLVLLNCDQDTGSFLLAVDRRTGQTMWRTDRGIFPRGFGTPIVWRHDSVEELVVPGTLWLKSYDVTDGKELWSVRGMARVVCTTPVVGDDLLFVASWTTGGDAYGERLTMPSFEIFAAEHDRNKDGQFTRDEFPPGPFLERFSQIDFDKDKTVTPAEWKTMQQIFEKVQNQLIALRPGGRGDITDSHVVWKQTRGLPYVPSPLYYRGRIYLVKNGGLASCFDARTGKTFYLEERLGALGDYYASPVAADGKIYAASQQGVIVVFAAGNQLNVLARNHLGETIMATPAIVEGKLYVRTSGLLYAFGK